MVKHAFTARQLQAQLANSFVCLFKPRDMSISALEKLLVKSICEQLNEVRLGESPPLPIIEMPIVKPHASGALVVVGHRKQIDYSLHPLVVGKMARPEEVRIEALSYLEPSSSGVCLFGLNRGCDRLESIREQSWLSEYFIEAELGRQTHDNQIRGKVSFRLEFDHVTKHRMNTVLSVLRMHFKSAAFQFANVDPHSQEAFELARRGTVRPKVLGSPLVHNLQLAQFRPPSFKLLVQATGESDKFLRELVCNIGHRLDTAACPRRLRRQRLGCFGPEHALLDKHFHVESVLKNALMCERMVDSYQRQQAADVIEVRAAAATTEMEGAEGHQQQQLVEDSILQRYHLTEEELEAEELPEVEDCLRLQFGRDYQVC